MDQNRKMHFVCPKHDFIKIICESRIPSNIRKKQKKEQQKVPWLQRTLHRIHCEQYNDVFGHHETSNLYSVNIILPISRGRGRTVRQKNMVEAKQIQIEDETTARQDITKRKVSEIHPFLPPLRPLERKGQKKRKKQPVICFHSNAEKITEILCGVKIETNTSPMMKRIWKSDKFVDEPAKGKRLEQIKG